MTNSKYSNEALRNQVKACFYDPETEDEDVPFNVAIDNLLALLEQTRTNTIDAAIAALPERWVRGAAASPMADEANRVQHSTIDQAKSNLLKLKKG